MPVLTSTTLGRFCRELAGGLDDIHTLLAEWGIQQPEFEALQRTPAFQAEMKLVQHEMQELGNDAGYVYRMKSLSESLLPELVQLLKNDATGPALKFEMIKWVAEMARLKEKPLLKNDPANLPRGPTVVFRFGAGLPVQSVVVQEVPEEEPPEPRMIDVAPSRITPVAVPRETPEEPTMEWPT